MAKNTPFLTEFDWLIAASAYMTGPTTYSVYRKRTLMDLLNTYRQALEGRLANGTERQDEPETEPQVSEETGSEA